MTHANFLRSSNRSRRNLSNTTSTNMTESTMESIECLATSVNQEAASLEFWCPVCHQSPLAKENLDLVCPACSSSFPVVQGLPILINNANSVFAIEDYAASNAFEGASYGSTYDSVSGLRGLYRKLVHRLSETNIKSDELDAETALLNLCKASPVRLKILVIGAGDRKYGDDADFVYTDVAFASEIHAIVDSHDLPFKNNCFDLVLAVAVLEHVASPQAVVDEIWRVLKPKGCVYAATPFLQPVHMGAYDFTRFTHLGHRRLFRKFSETASGLALGPASATALTIRATIVSLAPGKAYRRFANLFGIVFTFPLKYLDYLTRNNLSALDGAGGVYFFGRKEQETISDRSLIAMYRGGFK